MRHRRGLRRGRGSARRRGAFEEHAAGRCRRSRRESRCRHCGWRHRCGSASRTGTTSASFKNEPPRNTRRGLSESVEFVCTGSVAAPGGYGPYQSWHHSHTLPGMSWRPQAFAGLFAHGMRAAAALPRCQAIASAASGRRRWVAGGRAGAAGVFPLRLGRQGEGAAALAASQSRKARASLKVTMVTGCASVCGKPGLRQVNSLRCTSFPPSKPKPPDVPTSASVR